MMKTTDANKVWQRLYCERSERLRKLIALKAPECVVYMAAELLVKTEFRNSTRRLLWAWFVRAIAERISSWKSEWGIWKLRRTGWPRSCAIDIYFGDLPENHRKQGCDCGIEQKLLDEIFQECE